MKALQPRIEAWYQAFRATAGVDGVASAADWWAEGVRRGLADPITPAMTASQRNVARVRFYEARRTLAVAGYIARTDDGSFSDRLIDLATAAFAPEAPEATVTIARSEYDRLKAGSRAWARFQQRTAAMFGVKVSDLDTTEITQ